MCATESTTDVYPLFVPLWCAGMAWGSPGVLSHYAVRHGEGLPRGKALLVTVLAVIILLAATYGLLAMGLD